MPLHRNPSRELQRKRANMKSKTIFYAVGSAMLMALFFLSQCTRP